MSDCQFCTMTTGGHQDGCPSFVLSGGMGNAGVPTVVRECTCQQMPHRPDCMVVTGERPFEPSSNGSGAAGGVCGCMTMLKGEINAWLVAATGVEGMGKESFIAQASYLTSLLAQCEQRHHLQQVLPHD